MPIACRLPPPRARGPRYYPGRMRMESKTDEGRTQSIAIRQFAFPLPSNN